MGLCVMTDRRVRKRIRARRERVMEVTRSCVRRRINVIRLERVTLRMVHVRILRGRMERHVTIRMGVRRRTAVRVVYAMEVTR